MTSHSDDETDEPRFGKAHGKPPSWFARVPSAFIWQAGERKGKKRPYVRPYDRTDLLVMMTLCAHANNQGITFIGQHRISEIVNVDRGAVAKSLGKIIKHGHVNIISTQRSVWKGVMGNVYRIVYDTRLTDDEAIDEMSKVPEKDRAADHPILAFEDKHSTRNQVDADSGQELAGLDAVSGADIDELAQWYVSQARQMWGAPRLANSAARTAAAGLLSDGRSMAQIKLKATQDMQVLLDKGQPAPAHLGSVAALTRPSNAQSKI